jgi:hypothetical protein
MSLFVHQVDGGLSQRVTAAAHQGHTIESLSSDAVKRPGVGNVAHEC